MGAFTTVTAKGQITIPKEVRDELKLKAGTRIYISSSEGELIALVKNKSITELAGFMGKPPEGLGATLEDLNNATGAAAAEEDKRISGATIDDESNIK